MRPHRRQLCFPAATLLRPLDHAHRLKGQSPGEQSVIGVLMARVRLDGRSALMVVAQLLLLMLLLSVWQDEGLHGLNMNVTSMRQ